MSTYTYNQSESFTVTHARHMGAKVATDLLRFQRFYGEPSNSTIDDYEEELIALLKGNYLETVTYGFKRNGRWVEALRYHATAGGDLVADDDPGRLRPGANVASAHFTSYLTRNSRWWQLSEDERRRFSEDLPIQRTSGAEPEIENGYWAVDRTYSAGGRALNRAIIRRF